MYLILYIFNLNGIMKRIIDEEPKGSETINKLESSDI